VDEMVGSVASSGSFASHIRLGGLVFEGIFGGIVWVLANLLYIDLKRKGVSGWSRIILFFMGMPLTGLWLFLIREGSAPELEEAPDDAEALLAEIRRERRLNAGTSESETGIDKSEGPPPPGDGP
jgi:hypothetical protein